MAESAAKKPGLVERVKRFFRDAKGECKKVVWPTKKQIINNTGIVLVVMCIAAVFVGCLDGIASQLIRLFHAGELMRPTPNLNWEGSPWRTR